MGSDETHVDRAASVVNARYQSITIAFYSENHAVATHDTGIGVALQNIGWVLPFLSFDVLIPTF